MFPRRVQFATAPDVRTFTSHNIYTPLSVPNGHLADPPEPPLPPAPSLGRAANTTSHHSSPSFISSSSRSPSPSSRSPTSSAAGSQAAPPARQPRSILNLSAATGITAPSNGTGTILLQSSLLLHTLAVALWDTGAEGNFLSLRMARQLGLLEPDSKALLPSRCSVRYGDGSIRRSIGEVDLPLSLITDSAPHDCGTLRFIIADLQPSFDVVLGMPFCTHLRPRPDWQNLTIKLPHRRRADPSRVTWRRCRRARPVDGSAPCPQAAALDLSARPPSIAPLECNAAHIAYLQSRRQLDYTAIIRVRHKGAGATPADAFTSSGIGTQLRSLSAAELSPPPAGKSISMHDAEAGRAQELAQQVADEFRATAAAAHPKAKGWLPISAPDPEAVKAQELARQLLAEFGPDVLPDKLPPVSGPGAKPSKLDIVHRIQLKDGAQPYSRPLRRFSTQEMDELQKQLQELIDDGRIQPSESPWGTNVLFVKKKDGTLRFCVDYRGLNDLTVKNSYPLPHTEELFDRLAGARYFSKIDLRSGFHQIFLAPEDRAKTAFRTRYGHFEWTVLPMGLTNAPATFQNVMNSAFRHMLDRCVLVFLDDIVVYSRTLEDHARDVRAVFEQLRKYGLCAKLSKCELFRTEIEFLGHRVGRDGLRVMADKVKAVSDWPQPNNAHDVRSFLGLAGYYRRFVESFSKIAAVLHDLTHTADTGSQRSGSKAQPPPFVWTDKHQAAFDLLKDRLRNAPVLALPNPDLPYVVNTDASDYATGAVLQQDQGRGLQPIAYCSHKMTDPETRYPVHDKEMLAIVRALGEWRTYLHGRQPFTIRIRTDHNSLQYFMTQPSLSARQARWLDKLADFDFKIEYVKGETNNVADALSRRPDHRPPDGTLSFTPPPLKFVESTSQLCSLALNAFATNGKLTHTRAEFLALPLFSLCATRHPRRGPTASPQSSTLSAMTRAAASRAAPAVPSAPPAAGPSPSASSTPVPIDATSQRPPLDPMTAPLADVIHAAALCDPAYQALLASPSEMQRAGLRSHSGLLYLGDRIAIPADASLRTRLLSEAHDPIVSGHTGVAATTKRLQQRLYWKNMKADVHAYVTSCDSCQRFKVEQRKTAGLLMPLPVPPEPGHTLNLDFVMDLPRSRSGHTAYLSMSCSLSSVVQVGLCDKTVTAEQAARLVFQHWVRYYGLPVDIVSDRDPRFDKSRFWKALLALCGVNSRMSTAGHAQTDGRSENKQRSLHKVLRQYVDFEQTDWDEQLHAVVLSLNATHSASTGMTPFEIMLGRQPRLPLDAALDSLRAPPAEGDVPAAQTFLQRTHGAAWERARAAAERAQASQKKFADRHRRELKLSVGDEVLLSTRDLRLIATKDSDRKAKLAARFLGPFPITQVINDNAYKLALPRALNIHPVQNISKLRRYVRSPAAFAGRPVADSRPPPDAVDPVSGAQSYEVERILGKRLIGRSVQYLIKWAGWPLEDSSWVAARNTACPDLIAAYEALL